MQEVADEHGLEFESQLEEDMPRKQEKVVEETPKVQSEVVVILRTNMQPWLL